MRFSFFAGAVLLAACTHGAIVAPPRVRTTSDALLEASDWMLDGFPAISRDGAHVATVFLRSWGYRARVDAIDPDFNEPNGVEDYPNYFFVVAETRTGAIVRSELLIGADEFDNAQRSRSQPALATTVKRRLDAIERDLDAGGYERMPSAKLDEGGGAEIDGVRVRVTAERLVIASAAGRRDVMLEAWRGEPLPVSADFTCLYTPRIDAIALDHRRGIAVVEVAQNTNGGDACAGADNADHRLEVLRFPVMRSRDP